MPFFILVVHPPLKDDLPDADEGPPGNAGVAVSLKQVQDAAAVHRHHFISQDTHVCWNDNYFPPNQLE